MSSPSNELKIYLEEALNKTPENTPDEINTSKDYDDEKEEN